MKKIIFICLTLAIVLTSCNKEENFFDDKGTVKLQIQIAEYYKEITNKDIINKVLSTLNEFKYTQDSSIDDINGWQYRIKGYNEENDIVYDAMFFDDIVKLDNNYYSIDNSTYEILKNIYNELSIDEKNIYK